MKIYNYKNTSQHDLVDLFKRSAISTDQVIETIKPILNEIKKNGDKAVLKYARKLDRFSGDVILVSQNELISTAKKLDQQTKSAIKVAATNIEKFHLEQLPKAYSVETMQGVKCWRKHLPIENVGLYIPGGSAVLVSTMLMLGIPAKIAGCKRVIVCSPMHGKEIHPALAYAAKICGVKEFYKVGGAHSIAMMAYGTKKINKVDKIFGPGNQYVTAAKTLVSNDHDGCLIDMPAGPSEVLVIADETANPAFVASDLLAQAEHGSDSQVILLTNSSDLAKNVLKEIRSQIQHLPRKDLVEKSLEHSFILIVQNLSQAIQLSNNYAPEHLILNFKNTDKYLDKIFNAGSVFIGEYSPESVGDYASGTNHSLPTYGYAKSIGGVSVESFMKAITFQQLTRSGLRNISKTVIRLAETEKLDAHANAVKVRIKNGY
jgi:histidinol dehydrogenase